MKDPLKLCSRIILFVFLNLLGSLAEERNNTEPSEEVCKNIIYLYYNKHDNIIVIIKRWH